MNRMKQVFVLGLVGLGLISGGDPSVAWAAAGASPKEKKSETKQDRYKNLELFQKVLHFIETNYVEEVNNEELIHGAIKGMMATLDPHSNFLPPEVFKDMKIDTSGKFGGLGIEIGIKDGVLTIISPIEDTPAWRAGLKPLDRIVKINGESTKGLTLIEAVSKMRGKKGSKVIVSIYRRGFKKTKNVTVVRDIVKIRSVKSEMLEPGIGYVRLSSFNENAASDIKKAMMRIEKKKKLTGLVLDLRNNPGGLLDQAVEVSSLFLKEGVVVSTIGRDKDQKEVKHVRKGYTRTEFPIAILVNSATASAAEIVAGALQDHHRAVIMGEGTFGKGSVQTVIELGRDMGLKLTIARYYTPSGRSIQGEGVYPDIFLDQYDSKLLAKARIKGNGMREKDLKGHIKGKKKKEKEEFSLEELTTLGQKKKDDKDGDADEDMTPMRYEPKEDYQVKEALNYLKSYDIFKKLSTHQDEPAAAQVSSR